MNSLFEFGWYQHLRSSIQHTLSRRLKPCPRTKLSHLIHNLSYTISKMFTLVAGNKEVAKLRLSIKKMKTKNWGRIFRGRIVRRPIFRGRIVGANFSHPEIDAFDEKCPYSSISRLEQFTLVREFIWSSDQPRHRHCPAMSVSGWYQLCFGYIVPLITTKSLQVAWVGGGLGHKSAKTLERRTLERRSILWAQF